MEGSGFDDLIQRLMDAKKSKASGKKVQLSELEIRSLCATAKGLLPQPARPPRAGGAHQHLRRRAWAVLGPPPAVRVRWRAPHLQLPLPRRLRRPGEAEHRDHLPPARLQDQVPRQLLPPPRQPRVRLHQPHLRLLRRVQAPVQRPPLEALHRLLQLPAGGGHRGRQDLLHARGAVAGAAEHGPGEGDREAGGRAGPGAAVRPAVVGSRPGDQGVGGQRPRGLLHVWCGQGGGVP
ncbi:unnamed protein product [Musa textilis]